MSVSSESRISAANAANHNKRMSSRSQEQSDGMTFEEHLNKISGKSGKKMLSERELFAGSISHRLEKKFGSEAATAFRANLAEKINGGENNLAEAASRALKRTRVDGFIEREDAHSVRQESFQVSQLDSNFARLYQGGEGPRVAELDRSEAITMIEKKFAAIDNGELEVQTMGERKAAVREAKAAGTFDANVDETKIGTVDKKNVIEGNPTDGSEGFLWKPVSDHGPLAVLVPHEYKGQVESVAVLSDKGKVLEEGRDGGYGNGDRQHWRFSKTGSDYGNDLTLEVRLNSGKKIHYAIKDGAQRYD